MRLDQRCIVDMIQSHSKVLDIGCGDGSLIDYLCRYHQCDARGIELDMATVTKIVGKGLPVIQGNADQDLQYYPTDGFDYVVLSRTLQAVNRPKDVLQQMLRISRYAIVSFPNFGHWTLRAQLLLKGRMPMTTVWGKYWYETPNIRPCTIIDFVNLCEQENYKIVRWMAIDDHGKRAPWRRYVRLANFFGEQALFLLTR